MAPVHFFANFSQNETANPLLRQQNSALFRRVEINCVPCPLSGVGFVVTPVMLIRTIYIESKLIVWAWIKYTPSFGGKMTGRMRTSNGTPDRLQLSTSLFIPKRRADSPRIRNKLGAGFRTSKYAIQRALFAKIFSILKKYKDVFFRDKSISNYFLVPQKIEKKWNHCSILDNTTSYKTDITFLTLQNFFKSNTREMLTQSKRNVKNSSLNIISREL